MSTNALIISYSCFFIFSLHRSDSLSTGGSAIFSSVEVPSLRQRDDGNCVAAIGKRAGTRLFWSDKRAAAETSGRVDAAPNMNAVPPPLPRSTVRVLEQSNQHKKRRCLLYKNHREVRFLQTHVGWQANFRRDIMRIKPISI